DRRDVVVVDRVTRSEGVDVVVRWDDESCCVVAVRTRRTLETDACVLPAGPTPKAASTFSVMRTADSSWGHVLASTVSPQGATRWLIHQLVPVANTPPSLSAV